MLGRESDQKGLGVPGIADNLRALRALNWSIINSEDLQHYVGTGSYCVSSRLCGFEPATPQLGLLPYRYLGLLCCCVQVSRGTCPHPETLWSSDRSQYPQHIPCTRWTRIKNQICLIVNTGTVIQRSLANYSQAKTFCQCCASETYKISRITTGTY